MMQKYDYLIVGAGFAGAVVAERLASQLNKKVLIIDRRAHIGGNCYDCYDKFGVLVHKYGPHLFHTQYSEVYKYLSDFTKWIKCKHRIKACVDGKIYDLPINLNTINKFFHKNFTPRQCEQFLEKIRVKIAHPKNAQEQVISKIGWDIYRAFFENYTLKQWQIHPKNLEASVTARIPVRFNKDDSYFNDKYQLMPKFGYTKIFKSLLNHKNITIKLNTDFKTSLALKGGLQITTGLLPKVGKPGLLPLGRDKTGVLPLGRDKTGVLPLGRDKIFYNNLIYTGCIDEFFNYKFGRLSYRSLKFKCKNFNKPFFQKYVSINYPNDFAYTRIVEIKHATKQKINKTTIIYEYPMADGDPYYPVPQSKNQELYQKYFKLAQRMKNVYFVGRLAQYKYLNMDQVVLEALKLFKKISTINHRPLIND